MFDLASHLVLIGSFRKYASRVSNICNIFRYCSNVMVMLEICFRLDSFQLIPNTSNILNFHILQETSSKHINPIHNYGSTDLYFTKPVGCCKTTHLFQRFYKVGNK